MGVSQKPVPFLGDSTTEASAPSEVIAGPNQEPVLQGIAMTETYVSSEVIADPTMQKCGIALVLVKVTFKAYAFSVNIPATDGKGET